MWSSRGIETLPQCDIMVSMFTEDKLCKKKCNKKKINFFVKNLITGN